MTVDGELSKNVIDMRPLPCLRPGNCQEGYYGNCNPRTCMQPYNSGMCRRKPDGTPDTACHAYRARCENPEESCFKRPKFDPPKEMCEQCEEGRVVETVIKPFFNNILCYDIVQNGQCYVEYKPFGRQVKCDTEFRYFDDDPIRCRVP